MNELKETKICKCCGKEKSINNFEIANKDVKRGKIYYRSVCKECRKLKKNDKKQKPNIKKNIIERDTLYIWDENKKLKEIPLYEVKSVEHPIKHKLINIFEVFVQVEGTENYWISNFGRFVDNINYSNNKTFNEHEYSDGTFEIIETKADNDQYIRNTTIEDLVADTFLVQYRYRCNIWHKDGDVTNNWYKNKAISYAYMIYNVVRNRCEDSKSKCYKNTTMCEEWLNTPESFVKWYLNHYYAVNCETMAVDKDLFGNGSNEYAEKNCCLLPQGLNTLLTNCKKHYTDADLLRKDKILPLGVSKANEKYYGEITFASTGELKKLSLLDTPEEAFAEYKEYKQRDILDVLEKYKKDIPDYIYDKFLTVEVKPY